MSFHDDPLVIVYLVVAVAVIGYLIMLSVKARKETTQAQEGAAHERPHGDEKRPGEDLLLQFVQDREGKRYGETVAVEADQLVVKDGQTFYMAPLSSFEKSGDGVLVTGPVDWDEAAAAGEAWRERSTKVIEYDESEIPPEDLRED